MAEQGSGRRIAALAITGAVLVVASLAVGRLSAPHEVIPTTTSVEAGFARDMQVHHQQAVELSLLIRDLTDDPEIRLLAYDIAVSQSQQSGQMYGWLAEWGLPQAAPEPSMTWMTRPTLTGITHGHGQDAAHTPGSPMPGMATSEQIAALESATGADAEQQFLSLMIAHHEGGVEMAQEVIARSTNRVVVDLATSILAAQRGEIEFMTTLLAVRS